MKIVEMLQHFPEKVDAKLVSKTIKRYEELKTDKDRPGHGRKKKIDEALAKKKIEDLLRRKKRYPKLSSRSIAIKLHVSQRTAERLIKGKSFRAIEATISNLFSGRLEKKFRRRYIEQLLNPEQKKRRNGCCKRLFKRFKARKDLKRLILYDETYVSVEQASFLKDLIRLIPI